MGSNATPQARLLFKEAFSKLEETVTNTNRQDAISFKNTTLKDVYKATRDIEESLAKLQTLRNMARLRPFLDGLDHYSKVVEVLCNGTPYLSWIWAPVKLVLQIASEYPAAIEMLVAAYGKISDVLPRFDKLSEAFKGNSEFQRLLALVYSDILDFHREAYSFFRKRGWRFFFSTLCGRFGRRFKMILSNLADNCKLVDDEANTASVVEVLAMRKKMEEDSFRMETERAMIQLQAALAWLDLRDDEQEDELDRLSRLTHGHSCDWIQKNEKARLWMRLGSHQPSLWLTGKPGAGKSVLSAALIQFLRHDKTTNVLFYFCSYQASKQPKSAGILQTLVAQLLRSNNDLASYVYDEYIIKGCAPSIPQVRSLFQNLLNAVPSVRVVIDGLDELREQDQSRMLADMLPLATSKNSGSVCKILISSRDTPVVADIMSKHPKIHLNQERTAIDTSIKSFVHHEINLLSAQIGEIDAKADMNDIEQEFLEKADGMFLWVRLVLSALKKAYSIQSLRNIVHGLPKGLEKMYDKILERIIEDAGANEAEIIRYILSWTVYSCRPLKKIELASALSLRYNTGGSHHEVLAWKPMLDLCKPLLEESSRGMVTLIHFTAHEYFDSGPGTKILPRAKSTLGISLTCMNSLIQSLDILDPQQSAESQAREMICGLYGLCRYSVDFWLTHVLGSFNDTTDIIETQMMLGFMDALHDKHQIIEEFYLSEKEKRFEEIGPVDIDAAPAGLQNQPHLREFVASLLKFEKTLRQREFSNGKDIETYRVNHDATLLSEMLVYYQKLLLNLKQSKNVPGLAPQELAKFQQGFAETSLFCRFWGCGGYFSSQEALEDHESLHCGGIKCLEVSCPFHRIGFTSSKALKRHARKYHPSQEPAVMPTVRRKYVCSGTTEGYAWGCGQRFAFERELMRHIESREDTICDWKHVRNEEILSNFDFDSFLQNDDGEDLNFDFSDDVFGIDDTQKLVNP